MWTFMNQNQNDDVWATSNKDGVRRVLESDGMYAFMMEVGCNQTCERCLTGSSWSHDPDVVSAFIHCNVETKMLMKGWQDDIVTEWPSDRVTKWPSDQVSEWPSDQVTEWSSDRVTNWPSYRLTGSFADDWPDGIFLLHAYLSAKHTCKS